MTGDFCWTDKLNRNQNNFYIAAAAMVAGGDRLSLTESADEKGTAEQGTAIIH